jgi:hypothetical protein
MQSHQGDPIAGCLPGVFHNQGNVLEKAGQAVEVGERLDHDFEVFQAAGRIRRTILLPHAHVARFLKHYLCQLARRHGRRELAPALEVLEQA